MHKQIVETQPFGPEGRPQTDEQERLTFSTRWTWCCVRSLMPSRLNFDVAYLQWAGSQAFRVDIKYYEQHALLQSSVEPAEDARRDVVQVDLRHACKRGVVPRDVRVQEVVQLGGELDARRSTTNDAEVEELPAVYVRDRRLVRLLEAYMPIVRVCVTGLREIY